MSVAGCEEGNKTMLYTSESTEYLKRSQKKKRTKKHKEMHIYQVTIMSSNLGKKVIPECAPH